MTLGETWGEVGKQIHCTMYNVRDISFGQHCICRWRREHPFVFADVLQLGRQTSGQTSIRLKLTLGSFGRVVKKTTTSWSKDHGLNSNQKTMIPTTYKWTHKTCIYRVTRCMICKLI